MGWDERMGWMNGWDGMGWMDDTLFCKSCLCSLVTDTHSVSIIETTAQRTREIRWNLTVILQLIQLTFFQKVTIPGTHLMSLFLSRWKFKRRLATWRNLFPLRYSAWTSPRNTRKCLSCVRQNHFRQSCCYCLKPQGTSCNFIGDASVKTVTCSLCASNLQNKHLP